MPIRMNDSARTVMNVMADITLAPFRLFFSLSGCAPAEAPVAVADAETENDAPDAPVSAPEDSYRPNERDPLERDDCPPDTECQSGGNIIGDLNWVDATELTDENQIKNARASGKSTVRIGDDSYRCSATIIADDLIITNHHCAPDTESASTVRYYPTTESGVSWNQIQQDSFACGELLATDCAHDVSILRCQPNPNTGRLPGEIYGKVAVNMTSEFVSNEQVYTIHTNCDYRDDGCNPVKLLSPGKITYYGRECVTFSGNAPCQNCRSSALQARHTCDTLGGSSGGGVFDAFTHRYMGINWGSITRENDTGGINFATSIKHLFDNNEEMRRIFTELVACVDEDEDGFGAGGGPACRYDEADCDDSNAYINPGAAEVCDNRDNDCDGLVDDSLSRACGSSVGECRPGIETCSEGEWGDCNGAVWPKRETCNNRDDNCNGITDDGTVALQEAAPRCPDNGICAGGAAEELCTGGTWTCDFPQGYVEDECPVTDLTCGFGELSDPTCNDHVDNDCDGSIDEHNRYDQCEMHPEYWRVAAGMSCFVSENGECGSRGGQYKCTELAAACGISIDCQGAVFPQNEQCDGRDHDCDGFVYDRNDRDNDGWGDCSEMMDCDETRPTVNPGQAERCDGLDNDCNGATDEGNPCNDNDPCTIDTCRGEGGCNHERLCFADSATNLWWQEPAPPNSMNYDSAVFYCNNLTLAGRSDWRAPRIQELRSIVDGCRATETGGNCRVTSECAEPTPCRNGACDGCYDSAGEGPGYQGWYMDQNLHGGGSIIWSTTGVGTAANMRWAIDYSSAMILRWQTDALNSSAGIRCVRGSN